MLDFGLMKQIGLPSTGEVEGTPLYIPPEAVIGGIIDARSDLYSLGVLAYELSTGEFPFYGKTIDEIIKKHLEEEPIPPRSKRDMPEEFNRIILKLMAKDQNERYLNTVELLRDLSQLSGEKYVVETLEEKRSYLNCSELIGREEEINYLKQACGDLLRGKGRAIFVSAPAGVGKSRLIQELKLHIQILGITWTMGKCFEQGMSLYQPISEAFKPLVSLVKKSVVDKFGNVLVKVIPVLIERGYVPLPKLEEIEEKVRLFDSVTGWLKEVAQVKPLVIYIEDLQWSDFVTLELLNVCISQLRDYPILFLGSFRSDEIEPGSIIFNMVEEGLVEELKLSLLTLDKVRLIIQKMLGKVDLSDEFIEYVYKVTGGNPFFISESLRKLIEEDNLILKNGVWQLHVDVSSLSIPSSVEETILYRVNLLAPELFELLQISAVIGHKFDLSILKSIIEINEEKLFTNINELLERQFLKKEGSYYVFIHQRLRETLYNQLDENTRSQLHERVGNILEKRVKREGEFVSELAYHFARGKNKEKAVKYLVEAGRYAYTNCAFKEAKETLLEAERLILSIPYPQKQKVLFQIWEMVGIASMATEPRIAIEYLEKVRSYILADNRVTRTIRIMRKIFKIVRLLLPNILADRISLFVLRAKMVGNEFDRRGRIVPHVFIPRLIIAQVYLAFAYSFADEYEKAFVIAKFNLNCLPDQLSPVRAGILTSVINAQTATGRFIEMEEYAKEGISLFKRFEKLFNPNLDRDTMVISGFAYLNYDNSMVQRGKKFSDCLDKAIDIGERFNHLELVWWSNYVKALRFSYTGEYERFQEVVDKLIHYVKKFGYTQSHQMIILRLQVLSFLQREEVERAESCAVRLMKMGEQSNFSAA
ncbi:MAG: AAA family ATPase, partial [Candidatus Omnitrophica bacterium]|nr:AAA family ATPase [Candidatus Omnitrophota bacterium]